MKRRSALLILTLATHISFAKPLQIIWLQSDAPPFFFTGQAEGKRSGLCDYLMDDIISLTPDIHHTVVTVPQARITRYFMSGENVCFPCMLYRKEGHPLAHYSQITAIYPPLAVITSKEKLTRIAERHGNPVKLASLLADNELKYGQSVARKFSKEIQSLRESAKPNQQAALNYRAEDQARVSGQMILSGRIDYTIDYPFIKDYFNETAKDTPLSSLPIAGHQNEFLYGAIGCSTRAPDNFADKALSVINRLLGERILPSTGYKQHQAYWLGPYFENFIERYEKDVLKKSPPKTAGPEKN